VMGYEHKKPADSLSGRDEAIVRRVAEDDEADNSHPSTLARFNINVDASPRAAGPAGLDLPHGAAGCSRAGGLLRMVYASRRRGEQLRRVIREKDHRGENEESGYLRLSRVSPSA
jgi:hypothetical protein